MGVYFPGPAFEQSSPFAAPRADGPHGGIDFDAPHGTPIPVAADGVVVGRGYHMDDAYGYLVLVRHAAPDTTDVLFTLYAHMPHVLASPPPGRYVVKGEIIGVVGNTGSSGGPHLHFELISLAPRLVPWNEDDPWTGGRLRILNNGGRINPAQEWSYAGLDVFEGERAVTWATTPAWAMCLVDGMCE